VKLPDDLDARLRQAARRESLTIAQVTRAALEAHLGSGQRGHLGGHLGGNQRRHLGGEQRHLGAAANGHSGRDEVSARVEEIIQEEMRSSR